VPAAECSDSGVAERLRPAAAPSDATGLLAAAGLSNEEHEERPV
jgi:hypothetical protein